jgi:hypothetical protein
MIIVNLVGGLGNQLFQFAMAKAISNENEEIVLEYEIGSTRTLPDGQPEILAYTLAGNIRVSKRDGILAGFIAKVIGHTLRIQISPKKSIINRLYSFLIYNTSQLVLNAYYGRRLKLIAPTDLGYSEIIRSKSILLNGYFQTFHWADLISKTMKNLYAASGELERYRMLASEELPTIVHIRRGDYKIEDTFGLLSTNYYSAAIKYLESVGISEYIWVFSDEPSTALGILNLDGSKKVRLIPEMDLNSAQLLEIMKLGKAFVIANSTYSWWAAYLSDSKKIVAPETWFKGAQGPTKLIPDGWKQIDSSFE